MQLNIRFNGKENRQTFWAQETIGDLAMLEGKKDEARRVYEELEVVMEQSFGEQNQDLLALKEKIRSTSV